MNIGENVILRGMFHVVSGFPLHFMLYRGNSDCFSNSVHSVNKKLSKNIRKLQTHFYC